MIRALLRNAALAWALLAAPLAAAQAVISPVAVQAPLSAPYISGDWYLPPFATLAAGAALFSGQIACQEVTNLYPMTVTTLGVRITTLGTTNIQLGIYANAGNRPAGLPLAVTASIVDTSTGIVTAAPTGGAFLLPAGPYWDCVNAGDATVVLQTIAVGAGHGAWLTGSATPANLNDGSGDSRLILTFTSAFGTWPTGTGQTYTEHTSLQTGLIFLKSN